MDTFYGGTQSAQWWKISHEWLAEQKLYGKDIDVPRDWL
jgi:hypothetical protein